MLTLRRYSRGFRTTDASGPLRLKKQVSKAELRAELQGEVDRFLRDGGQVQEIPRGVSGREPGDGPLLPNRRLFIEPREPRTQIPEVIAAIEARRQSHKRDPARKRKRPAPPRRKVIYDDFGEPLREVWVEED